MGKIILLKFFYLATNLDLYVHPSYGPHDGMSIKKTFIWWGRKRFLLVLIHESIPVNSVVPVCRELKIINIRSYEWKRQSHMSIFEKTKLAEDCDIVKMKFANDCYWLLSHRGRRLFELYWHTSKQIESMGWRKPPWKDLLCSLFLSFLNFLSR